MKRREHLEWAKKRALEQTNSIMMWVSFLSNMSKHNELKDYIGFDLVTTVDLNNTGAVKRFIDGFN